MEGEKLGGHQVNPTQYVDGKNCNNKNQINGNFERNQCNIKAQAWPWTDIVIGMNPLVMDYQRKGGWRLL